jgi:hypothetical protein
MSTEKIINVPDGIDPEDFYLCVFAHGILDEAQRLGYIQSAHILTPKGISDFDQLIACGYFPDPIELAGYYLELTNDLDFCADMLPITEIVYESLKTENTGEDNV